jgi:hypothetical protein
MAVQPLRSTHFYVRADCGMDNVNVSSLDRTFLLLHGLLHTSTDFR